MDISLNIRRARINAALSQRDLARLLGVSSVAVVKWESGKTFPSANKLPALANALGVSIDELYGRDSPPPAN